MISLCVPMGSWNSWIFQLENGLIRIDGIRITMSSMNPVIGSHETFSVDDIKRLETHSNARKIWFDIGSMEWKAVRLPTIERWRRNISSAKMRWFCCDSRNKAREEWGRRSSRATEALSHMQYTRIQHASIWYGFSSVKGHGLFSSVLCIFRWHSLFRCLVCTGNACE